MRLVSNVAILATFAGALTFVLAYAWTTRGRWTATVMGKHIMTFMVVITVVSSLAVISIFKGSVWPYRDVIRALAWGAVAAVIWWRVFLLFRSQREPYHPGGDADRRPDSR